MNLGENIYRLRTQKNLSQGELADALEVSRQSVSKWENNSAVPELDKLIRMARIFDITLDELVVSGTAPTSKTTPIIHSIEFPEPPRQVSGTVPGILFLSAALLVWILLHFLYAIPLLACCVLCLCLKRRWGLWCCWVMVLSASCILYSGTGIGIQWFWIYLVNALESVTGVYQLLSELALNAAIAGMSIWSARSYLGTTMRLAASGKSRLLLGWGLTLIPLMLTGVASSFKLLCMKYGYSYYGLISYSSFLFSWLHLTAIMVMLARTVGFLKYFKEKERTL